jgi:hypothetical protein
MMPYLPSDNLFRAWHDAVQITTPCDDVSGEPKPVAVYSLSVLQKYRRADPTPAMDPAAQWMFNSLEAR